jgi:hypothetical protein
MSEYNKMAKGRFTATGTSAVVQLPFQPDFVELWNYTNIKTAAVNSVTMAWWDSKLIDPVLNSNPTMIQLYSGSSTATVFDIIANTPSAVGINAYSAGQLLQFGPLYKHESVAGADFEIAQSGAGGPTTVTTDTDHGLVSGDVIIFEGLYQTATTGMPQLNYIWFTVTVTGATTFTIPWDTSGSNYTAFNSNTSTGNIGAWRKVLYPYIYFPGTTTISNITLGATTTIDTTDAHNLVVGQEVAFRIPSQWGTTELNSLPNTLVPGSPVYGYVIAVTDYNTVVVNINSSAMTPFVINQPVSIVSGLSYPQIVAVGDVNTGGVQISSGSALYPPPYYVPIGTTRINTINGPAIQGAFVNNTSQGFTIGSGIAAVDGTATLIQEGDIIVWRAFLHDISLPS